MAIRWSIVITTCNRAEMLRRAIKSCVEQTVPCEIVVVDEGSGDDTPDVVKNIPRLKYIRHQRPLGHSISANRGIKEADADWIKPLDDDDWLAPECVEKMSAAIEAARTRGFRPVIVSGGAINVDEGGRELGYSRSVTDFPSCIKSRDLLRLMMFDLAPIGMPVQVGHEREAALRVGGWNEHRPFSHQHGDETEFWIKLAAEGDCVFIPSPIGNRTLWPGGSQSHLSPAMRFRSNLYLKELIAAALNEGLPDDVESYLALHWALAAAKAGEYAQAAKLGVRWLKRPGSIAHLFAMRSLKKAIEVATPLEVD